jgi:hypothetical protein
MVVGARSALGKVSSTARWTEPSWKVSRVAV